MKKILVIGVKNTFRSIIASQYLGKLIAEKALPDISVISAGVMAFPDIPAEPEAVTQLEKLGISGAFVSTPLKKTDIAEADIIITMSEKIKAAILMKFPDALKVHTLSETAGLAGDVEASETCGGQIKELIEKGFEFMTGVKY